MNNDVLELDLESLNRTPMDTDEEASKLFGVSKEMYQKLVAAFYATYFIELEDE